MSGVRYHFTMWRTVLASSESSVKRWFWMKCTEKKKRAKMALLGSNFENRLSIESWVTDDQTALLGEPFWLSFFLSVCINLWYEMPALMNYLNSCLLLLTCSFAQLEVNLIENRLSQIMKSFVVQGPCGWTRKKLQEIRFSDNAFP